MDKNLLLGSINQGCWIVGWLPNELVLAVDSRTKEYTMQFTIQTYSSLNKLVLVKCVAEGMVAKQIYEQYKKLDIIMVWGELMHVYKNDIRSFSNKIRILDFVLPAFYKISMKEAEPNDETKSMLDYVAREAYDYYLTKNSNPSQEEIKKWVDYWEKYNKRHN